MNVTEWPQSHAGKLLIGRWGTAPIRLANVTIPSLTLAYEKARDTKRALSTKLQNRNPTFVPPFVDGGFVMAMKAGAGFHHGFNRASLS